MKLEEIPDKPGVYLFMDSAGSVLYIGKAKSLKKRVRSHFGRENLDARHMVMITRVRTVDYILTETENEALVLEEQLIKSVRPRYNILLRDGKTYPYLEVDTAEDFPSLRVARKKDNPGSVYFGPFPNVSDMRKAKKAAESIFPLRKCARLRRRERPCLNYQIGHCLSPCTGAADPGEYAGLLEELLMFLGGKNDDLIEKLKRRMEVYKERAEYEKAAAVRDQISRLENIFPAVNVRRINRNKINTVAGVDPLLHLGELLAISSPPRVIEGFDISHTSSRMASGGMVRFVSGKPDKQGYRRFSIRQKETHDDLSMLKEVVYRRLKRLVRERKPLPDVIFVDGGKGQCRAASEAAGALGLEGVKIISLAKVSGAVYHNGKKLDIDPGSRTYRLIKYIDEEAHRFAHAYHTRRRGGLS